MGAVSLELLHPRSLDFATRVLHVAIGGPGYATGRLPLGTECDWSWIESATAPVSYVAQQHGRANRLIRATASATAVHDALRARDDDACDTAIVNWLGGFTAYTDLNQAMHPDIVWSDTFFQVKSTLDMPPADTPGTSNTAVSVPAMPAADSEASVRWRGLACYRSRSLTIPACAYCQANLPEITPDALTSAQTPSTAEELISVLVALARAVVGIRVSTRDKRLVQDYRDGLRRFIDGILAALRFMVIMVLAALSRRPQAPAFLLVLLAAARHYGHRSEPDGHFPPPPAVQPRQPWGAASQVT